MKADMSSTKSSKAAVLLLLSDLCESSQTCSQMQSISQQVCNCQHYKHMSTEMIRNHLSYATNEIV